MILISFADIAGKYSGLMAKEQILLNVACSHDQEDFNEILNKIEMPVKLKSVNDDGLWQLIKANLNNECYG